MFINLFIKCDHHTEGNETSCDSTPEQGTPACTSSCSNQAYTVSYKNDKVGFGLIKFLFLNIFLKKNIKII
jgi:hypothetical protein